MDSLSKIAAFNIEDLLLKLSETSKGVIYNICQSLLKEWGLESLGALLEDIMQHLLMEVKKNNFFHRSLPLSFMWISIHVITLFISNGVFLLSPQGLTLLELAAHLEGTDTKLRHKGLGKV